jgi:hypothetical protein
VESRDYILEVETCEGGFWNAHLRRGFIRVPATSESDAKRQLTSDRKKWLLPRSFMVLRCTPIPKK